ncbi:MAG: acyl-CoA thioesterase [Planctomycetota bacterium]
MTHDNDVLRHKVRVRYCETDCMGVAHHGSYVAWLEEARTEWMRARGKSYQEVEATGFYLQVVSLDLRYKRPARYDEELVVVVSESGRKRSSMTLAYEVQRAVDGTLIATGETTLACTDKEGRVRRLPPGV